MAEWTPESKEYFESYLTQVRILARQAGEDGEDISAGLREHITTKIDSEAHALVTLAVLRQTLLEVGTPEEIAGVGIGGALSRSTSTATGDAIAGPRGKSSRWAVIAGTLFLAAIVALCLFSNFDAIAVRTKSDESIAREVCLKIRAAQTAFVAGGVHDADRDGVPDFGTLQQLLEAGLISEELSSGIVHGLHISLKVKASDNKGPSYTCSVKRNPADAKALYEINDEKPLVVPAIKN